MLICSTIVTVNCLIQLQVTIIALIAGSTWKLKSDTGKKYLRMTSLNQKVYYNYVLFLNTMHNLKELSLVFNDLFNSVMACKDIRLMYGITKAIFSQVLK